MRFKHIRDLREDFDLSQSQLSKKLGMPQSQYARYEIGDRNFQIEHLIKLANFYNVSIDYLLDQTNRKERLK